MHDFEHVAAGGVAAKHDHIFTPLHDPVVALEGRERREEAGHGTLHLCVWGTARKGACGLQECCGTGVCASTHTARVCDCMVLTERRFSKGYAQACMADRGAPGKHERVLQRLQGGHIQD